MLLIKNEHHTLFGGGRDYHTTIFSLPLTFFPNLFLQKETRHQTELTETISQSLQ